MSVYTTVPGKLPKVFEYIESAGVPTKVDGVWLKKLGFTSSNDRSIIPVLKFISFVDEGGVPTQTWREYRGANSRKVLGNTLMNAYEDLFHTMPNADSASVESLTNYFRANTTAGEQAVSKIVSTFRNLAGLADFSNSDFETAKAPESNVTPRQKSGNGLSHQVVDALGDNGVPFAVNLNIQLTLPATDEQAVFDAIFKSLRENILNG